MDLDNLTIGEAKKIAAFVNGLNCERDEAPEYNHVGHAKRPVVVCTDKRGVVFGYCTDVAARPVTLQKPACASIGQLT